MLFLIGVWLMSDFMGILKPQIWNSHWEELYSFLYTFRELERHTASASLSNNILQVDEFQISTVMTPFLSKEGLTLNNSFIISSQWKLYHYQLL